MQGLVILGMHRSGTSAAAGQCAALGLSFGDNLLPPQSDNPKGYYEDREITGANDLLVTALFGGWDSPVPWNEATRLPSHHSYIQGITDSAKKTFLLWNLGQQNWAVKDPRFSRLLPIWCPIFQSMKLDVAFIMVVRRPSEVAASLQKRDGLGLTTSRLLWFRHVAEPLAYAIDHGLRIGIIPYDTLVRSPERLSTVLHEIGVSTNPAVHSPFVDAALRHHHAHESLGCHDDLNVWCEELYSIAVARSVFSLDTVSSQHADMVRAARELSFEPYLKDLYLEAKGLLPRLNAGRADGLVAPHLAHKRLAPAITLADLRRENQILKNNAEILREQLESRTSALARLREGAKNHEVMINSVDQQAEGLRLPATSASSTTDIMVQEFSELQEFLHFRKGNPDFFVPEELDHAAKRIAKKGFYCNIFREAAAPEAITINDENYRETIVYKGMNSRLRATHWVLEQAMASVPSDDLKIFAPEAMSGYAAFHRNTNKKFFGAEYTTDARIKEWLFPIPIEDIQKLTFPDRSFRATFVNEIFVTVPFLDKALRELARILMPGGKLVSTFPFYATSEHSLIRAKMGKWNRQIEYLEEPQYSRDALGGKGLVFEIPGWEILNRTRAAGFRTATMQWVYSESCGMLAPHTGGVMVLLAEK